MSKSQIGRSGRRASDITLRPALRCKKGDLAIRLQGEWVGYIVEVVQYYPTIKLDSGKVLINAWHVRHETDDPNTDYFAEDKHLLPIRPGDLEENGIDELSLVKGESA